MTTSNPTVAGPSDADRAAVAALPGRVVEAWARHDADTFAAVFTADGTMILPGLFKKGRDEIRAYMRDAFADQYRDTRVTGRPVDVKFLGPDSGVLITQGG